MIFQSDSKGVYDCGKLPIKKTKNILRKFSFHLTLVSLLFVSSCTSIQVEDYELPFVEGIKKQDVTFELLEILSKGEAYNARPEEFKKTEEMLEKAIQGGGFPDAKLSKGGEKSNLHLKIKVDVYNPPWYLFLFSVLNSTLTIGTAGIIPAYSGPVQHKFHFEVLRPGKPTQNFKVDGPKFGFWFGWMAGIIGNSNGDAEGQIIGTWKLIVKKFSPQVLKPTN